MLGCVRSLWGGGRWVCTLLPDNVISLGNPAILGTKIFSAIGLQHFCHCGIKFDTQCGAVGVCHFWGAHHDVVGVGDVSGRDFE